MVRTASRCSYIQGTRVKRQQLSASIILTRSAWIQSQCGCNPRHCWCGKTMDTIPHTSAFHRNQQVKLTLHPNVMYMYPFSTLAIAKNRFHISTEHCGRAAGSYSGTWLRTSRGAMTGGKRWSWLSRARAGRSCCCCALRRSCHSTSSTMLLVVPRCVMYLIAPPPLPRHPGEGGVHETAPAGNNAKLNQTFASEGQRGYANQLPEAHQHNHAPCTTIQTAAAVIWMKSLCTRFCIGELCSTAYSLTCALREWKSDSPLAFPS